MHFKAVARTVFAVDVDDQEARARGHSVGQSVLIVQLLHQVRDVRHWQAVVKVEAVVQHGVHLD